MKKPNSWLRLALMGCVLLGGIACANAAKGQPSGKTEGEVAARIGDHSITLEELDAKAILSNSLLTAAYRLIALMWVVHRAHLSMRTDS